MKKFSSTTTSSSSSTTNTHDTTHNNNNDDDDDNDDFINQDHGGGVDEQPMIRTFSSSLLLESNSDDEKALLDHVELSIPKQSIKTSTIGGYSLTILGTQMLNHIFNSYYVETFLFIHNLPYNYFYIGQFLFAIFNAINDPLFGYISDELINDKKKRYSRQRLMLFGAPFLVISFLLPWIQIRGLFEGNERTGVGDFVAFVQFICALFFWDTSYTWLVLNHCSLLPELTESDREKGKISTAVSTCSVLGSLFLLPTFILFERPNQENSNYTGNLNYFRIYCTCLAVLSFCIIYFGNYLINRGRAQSRVNSPMIMSTISDEEVPKAPSETKFTFKHLVYIIKTYLFDFFGIFKQLISLKNFDLFVVVNFLNIFSVALFDSFKVRYIRYYVQPWMENNFSLFTSGNMASIYLTVTTFTSESCAVMNSYLSIRYPAYTLLRNTFILRCIISILSLIAVTIAVHNYEIVGSALPVLFLFCNMIILGSVGRLLEIALSNVVDEDYIVFKRKEKNSGNTFGINALLTKPAYSLAPSVAALFVNQDKVDSGAAPTLFYLFVVGNLICAALQLIFWKFYSLKGQQPSNNNNNNSGGGGDGINNNGGNSALNSSSIESSSEENCH